MIPFTIDRTTMFPHPHNNLSKKGKTNDHTHKNLSMNN